MGILVGERSFIDMFSDDTTLDLVILLVALSAIVAYTIWYSWPCLTRGCLMNVERFEFREADQVRAVEVFITSIPTPPEMLERIQSHNIPCYSGGMATPWRILAEWTIHNEWSTCSQTGTPKLHRWISITTYDRKMASEFLKLSLRSSRVEN